MTPELWSRTWPHVTVVMPCYNGGKYLAEAIQSVLDQDYPYIKILVVDDASTDNSREIVAEFAAKHSGKISIVPLEQNGGPCNAVEVGYKAAFSYYTAMLAADDMYLDPRHISQQVVKMEATGADWCYNTMSFVGETPETAEPMAAKWLVHYLLDNLFLHFPGFCLILSAVRNPVNSSSLMIRQQAFVDNNLTWGPNLRSACDGLIIAKMLRLGLKGIALNNASVFYRSHANQVSKTTTHSHAVTGLQNKILNCHYSSVWLMMMAWVMRKYVGMNRK